MTMKYIMLEYSSTGQVTKTLPILFAKDIIHSDMAELVAEIRMFTNESHTCWMWPRVVSAGFYDGERCYGRSESLNLDSIETDTAIVKQHI